MRRAVALLLLGAAGVARAQDMGTMTMPAPPQAPAAGAPAAASPQPSQAGGMTGAMPMDNAAMKGMGAMTGDLGGYAMSRDASGTAWQPDSSPMDGVHAQAGGWALMAHGYATLAYDDQDVGQGGGRGADKTFVESMFMGMAQHPYGGGVLTLRAMGSLDPLMGRTGYPLLLATGETADGKTPLVDRQHPHDLVMELAGVYEYPLVSELHGFVYAGWPGEPALGPATYMHRFSGEANPEAPIGHHWLDSTHITFGVATGGLVWRAWKLEASGFKGREPNQNRYDFDHPRLDSWSTRLSWNPTPDWSLQVSHGHLKSPEQLTPDQDQDRATASATYNTAFGKGRRWGGDWQTTAAWGEDADHPGHVTNEYLLDSAVSAGRHTLFFRAENVSKDDLFSAEAANPLSDRVFNVSQYTTGYYYTLPFQRVFALDLGGLVTRYSLPTALNGTYGADPASFLLFTRVRLR